MISLEEIREIRNKISGSNTQEKILDQCLFLAEMLITKNLKYGDSAIKPIRFFSKASNIEQIKVRIDDKLNRILKTIDDDEDVVLDLIGYLILLRIAKGEKQ